MAIRKLWPMGRICGLLLAGMALGVGPVLAESAPGIRYAQVTPGAIARPVVPSAEQRQEDQLFEILRELDSACNNAAWTLWRTNSYDDWRNRRARVLSIQYSVRSYERLPPLPASLPEALKLKAEPAIKSANETLGASGEVFKDLSTYINAKDYEDDKFKKGDELNAKLLAAGKRCHQLEAELAEIYRDAAALVIERRKAGAPRPEIVATMIADWQKASALSRELGRFELADRATLEGLVRDLSAVSDERKANFEPLKQAPQAQVPQAVKGFYETTLQDDIAAKMRRLLREAKTPKAFKEVAQDRPRSEFWSVRREIDYAMPDAILNYLRNPG
ncbi:DUF3829 domain-containing protein [Bosea vaviloviae]|uniref:Uncharacterized protein n=1 Tax=Bosea vaviloviae TaxID=1526658 RepID=A0A1D7U1H5_9HYPH|nr:DUF3829 domain-containing protein [Bosea vaviloviae]AOO81228.1 hypothetical protein BHK69_12810 [Bosea vaviloviae]